MESETINIRLIDAQSPNLRTVLKIQVLHHTLWNTRTVLVGRSNLDLAGPRIIWFLDLKTHQRTILESIR